MLGEGVIEEKLMIATRLFNSVMEGIVITDTDGVIKLVNPSFTRITGYGEEAIGLNPRVLKSGKHSDDFYIKMWNSIITKGEWKGEIWNKRKNGELYIQWATITSIKDDMDNTLFYTGVFTDITENKKEEEQFHHDLLLAKEVQKGLLSKAIQDEQLHVEGVYSPSLLLGGDMYAWYKIDESRYGIFLMDVMGHGIASALVCVSFRALLRGIINSLVFPKDVLEELNKHVFSLYSQNTAILAQQYYMTGIYVLVDTKSRTIHYSSAGHPPCFYIDEVGNATELDKGCVPLGMLKNLDVETGIIPYSGKGKIVLYTDGLLEGDKASPREHIERLKNFFIQNRHMEVDKLLNATMTSFSSDIESLKFEDDVTIIAAEIK